MSLLGFDALGRLALGQFHGGRQTITLAVSPGVFALTGSAATFTIKEAAAVGPFALTGVSASFTVKEAVTYATFSFSGVPVSFTVSEAAATGLFTASGKPANETTIEQDAPGAFVVTGNDADLLRTGADFDLVYGGVGHYLLEQERAKQLAKITRRAPGPVDRTTAPRFKSIGSPPVALGAPVVDLAAIQKQRATAQMQAAAAMKRRRDEEAILLLAS